MDNFKVPKKMNRHALKALNALSPEGSHQYSVSSGQILNQVKYQMRKLVPVDNIEMLLKTCLKNLCNVGLINRAGRGKFRIGDQSLPIFSQRDNKSATRTKVLFKPKGSRKRNCSQLKINAKSQCLSGEALQDGDQERTDKRRRTNKKRLTHKGRKTKLPKARRYNLRSITAVKSLLSGKASSTASKMYRHAIEDFDQALDMNDMSCSPPIKKPEQNVVELFKKTYNLRDLSNRTSCFVKNSLRNQQPSATFQDSVPSKSLHTCLPASFHKSVNLSDRNFDKTLI